ncbi:MAG: C4-type zinc ribbon domain-containing protein [Planctomycetota bacterium]|nr:C4-type zinc ribbon domain-containing protein [Planctomycetota bacterium]MDA1114131.1 C4-type zinc ribbon domain-containing protein [Planctomycetota bacterium]
MEAILAQLLRAQQVDKRLTTLARRLESLPVELGERESTMAALEAEAEELEAEKRACFVRSTKLENECGTREDRINKLEKQAIESRDPSSAQIAQHEATTHRQENSAAQEEALELLERADGLAAKREAMNGRLDEAKESLDAMRASVEADAAELQADVDTLSAEREELVADVNTTVRSVFQTLSAKHPGKAVVPVKGNSCGGCGTNLTANDRVRVQAAKGMTRCPSCTRILVMQDLWTKMSEPVQ